MLLFTGIIIYNKAASGCYVIIVKIVNPADIINIAACVNTFRRI